MSRQLKTVKVFINSRDRQSGTNEAFNYAMGQSAVSGIIGYAVQQITIPATYYIINTSTNQLVITESISGAHTVTLTPGNYVIGNGLTNDFAANLTTAINGSGVANTYAVTISAVTGIMTITRTTGTQTFGITFPATSALNAIIGDFPAGLSAGPVNGSKVVRIAGPPNMYIFSQIISNAASYGLTSIEASQPSTIIASIPLLNLTKTNGAALADTQQAETIYYDGTDEIQPLAKFDMSSVDLRLSFSTSFLDPTVNLNNNSWSMTLILYTL